MQDMQGSPMSAQLAYAQVTAAKPLPEPERRHSDTEGFGSSSLPRAQGLPKPTKVSGLPPRQTPGMFRSWWRCVGRKVSDGGHRPNGDAGLSVGRAFLPWSKRTYDSGASLWPPPALPQIEVLE
jgi:hypothetical protein